MTVTNTGPGTFSGDITVADTLSVADPVFNNAPWSCTNPGPSHTCTDSGVTLNPGASAYLWLVVFTPKPGPAAVPSGQCDVSNTVHITSPPRRHGAERQSG